jgi:hypothetical protein
MPTSPIHFRMAFFGRLCLLLLLIAGNASAAGPAMEYRYWDWGKTPKRDDYQLKALELALEKTRAEYGAYKIVRVLDTLSTFRVRNEVYAGTRVNLFVEPWRALDPRNPLDRNIAIEIPLMGGLLGFRNLIIRRDDLATFAAITSAAQLQKLVAGMGRNWAEVPIYKRNGYRIDDTGTVRSLAPMLANRRVDYIPMSVTEIDAVLALNPALADQLAVAPGMLIEYPQPAIFYVSANQPELAARLRNGLLMASHDGSLNELLLHSFGKEIQSLRAPNMQRFTLSNPGVPKHLLEMLPTPLPAPCRKLVPRAPTASLPAVRPASASVQLSLKPCP